MEFGAVIRSFSVERIRDGLDCEGRGLCVVAGTTRRVRGEAKRGSAKHGSRSHATSAFTKPCYLSAYVAMRAQLRFAECFGASDQRVDEVVDDSPFSDFDFSRCNHAGQQSKIVGYFRQVIRLF